LSQTCEFVKPDGTRCRAKAVAGGTLCFFHDPDRAAQRQQARREGGRSRSRPARTLGEDAPDLRLKTAADVVRLLAEAINHTRRGAMDPKVANAIGCLAGQLLRAIDGGETDRRLTALEKVLAERGEGLRCGPRAV
jgi:hypothetical protein